MDFKVVGSEKGIIVLQMDMKIIGFLVKMVVEVVNQVCLVRFYIFEKMFEVIDIFWDNLFFYVLCLFSFWIDFELIGIVIGFGGCMIKGIIECINIKIDIEDGGIVIIVFYDGVVVEEVQKIIEGLICKVNEGEVFFGLIIWIILIGVFVEIFFGKEGMIYILQFLEVCVEKVEDVVKVGDEVIVWVCEIDNCGCINFILWGVF